MDPKPTVRSTWPPPTTRAGLTARPSVVSSAGADVYRRNQGSWRAQNVGRDSSRPWSAQTASPGPASGQRTGLPGQRPRKLAKARGHSRRLRLSSRQPLGSVATPRPFRRVGEPSPEGARGNLREKVDFAQIKRQGGWKHDGTVRGYIEEGQQFTDNAASTLLTKVARLIEGTD